MAGVKKSRSKNLKKLSYRIELPTLIVVVMILFVCLAVGSWWSHKQAPKTRPANQVSSQPSANEKKQIVVLKSEEEFLNQMIPYNQEAVDSSRYLLTKTANSDLKSYATNAINQRNKEIWTMLGFYQKWYGRQYTDTPGYTKFMPDLTQLSGQELDKAYIRAMIDHHAATIEMAGAVANQTNKENFKAFAQNLSKVHTEEMDKLKSWLEKYPQ